MRNPRRRTLAAAAVLAASTGLALAPTAHAAPAAPEAQKRVSTDYWWSAWLRCQFGRVWTYENARYRVDYSHTSTGRRNYKWLSYSAIQGSTVVHRMVVQEVAANLTTVISQRDYPTLNASTYTAYVEPSMTRVPDTQTTYWRIYLYLADGQVCSLHQPMPA
jgi:hypothetical protein